MNLAGTNINDWTADHWDCFRYQLGSRTHQKVMDAHGLSEVEAMGFHRQFKQDLGMACELEVDFSNPSQMIFYRG